MKRWGIALLAVVCFGCLVLFSEDELPHDVVTGPAAFHSFEAEHPGVYRKITVADLPEPYATRAVSNGPKLVPHPAGAIPQAPPGFKVQLYASGLDDPRLMRTAPNGDVFLAESFPTSTSIKEDPPGRILVLRGLTATGNAASISVFATNLNRPFGIAFYPPGPDPQYVYVGENDKIVRFPYHNGDLKATGQPEVIVPHAIIQSGGNHWTRDVVFPTDGKKMYVSVGSFTNVEDIDADPDHHEERRANVLEFDPDGSAMRIYASGIRNCVGEAIQPETGELWCSVNERDDLGDNLPPDYITHVEDGGFYGWPWYYIGGHPDPRFPGKHPELKDKTIVPDVLLQAHNASLEMLFYEGGQFPKEYHGDIFAAEHGSWNRALRTGYEVIRVPVKDGKATGEYEDFLTGFATSQTGVWGRPVGVTVMEDGSLLVSDDGSNSVWRVSYVGTPKTAPNTTPKPKTTMR
ncbi:MAG: PQQ-dependent sugar dehydrogenase [Candidatus Acidiferrales bacterium]